MCEALILDNPKSRQGPRSITFQYERGKNRVWRGGYAVETRQQFFELSKGRGPFVGNLHGALKKVVGKGVERAAVILGDNPRKKVGPELRVYRTGDRCSTFHDVSGPPLERWKRVSAGQGVSCLPDVVIEAKQPRPDGARD